MQDYKSGKRGQSQICHDLKLKSGKALYRWVSLYDEYGEIGFLPKRKNKAYSKELKEKAINDYLSGKGSYKDIIRKYEISSDNLVDGLVMRTKGL